MATPVDARNFSLRAVDEWVLSERPSVEEAAAQVAAVRRLAREVRIAEAHLVGYLRDELGVDDMADVPEELFSVTETDD